MWTDFSRQGHDLHPQSFLPHAQHPLRARNTPSHGSISYQNTQEPSVGHKGRKTTQGRAPTAEAHSKGLLQQEGWMVLHTCLSLIFVPAPNGEGQPARAPNVLIPG